MLTLLQLSQVIKIARDIYKGHTLKNGQEWVEHPKRMAERAMLCGCSNIIVAGCWLHDAWQFIPANGEFPLFLEDIKDINEELSEVVSIVSPTSYQSPQAYASAVRLSGYPKTIKWFETLDLLNDLENEEETNHLLSMLSGLHPTYLYNLLSQQKET